MDALIDETRHKRHREEIMDTTRTFPRTLNGVDAAFPQDHSYSTAVHLPQKKSPTITRSVVIVGLVFLGLLFVLANK